MNLQTLSVPALRKRRRQLVRDLPPIEHLLRGTLVEAYKRCGRPNCHCVDGPGHGPKRYLSISQPGGRDLLQKAIEDASGSDRMVPRAPASDEADDLDHKGSTLDPNTARNITLHPAVCIEGPRVVSS
jgi:hypothetical protein